MKPLPLAAALILTGLATTSFLRSETRRLTASETAAISVCASRYYVCNGQCQNSSTVEARASCEAECMRTYNACVNASVRPLPTTDVPVAPSPSPVARPAATAMPRNISSPRVSGPTATTKPVATIAPRGVVPKQAIATTVPPGPPTVPKGVARRPASEPALASPTPTLTLPNFSRRPIGGSMRKNPTPTIPPQAVPRGPVATASPPPAAPTVSPHRSTSRRKTHRRHRSKESSPTPTPTSQPTPAT